MWGGSFDALRSLNAGYEIYPYYDGDLLYNCDDVWSCMGLEGVTPDMIEEICKMDGHYCCVPSGIHRTQNTELTLFSTTKRSLKSMGERSPQAT